jgi:hypothetical protein
MANVTGSRHRVRTTPQRVTVKARRSLLDEVGCARLVTAAQADPGNTHDKEVDNVTLDSARDGLQTPRLVAARVELTSGIPGVEPGGAWHRIQPVEARTELTSGIPGVEPGGT